MEQLLETDLNDCRARLIQAAAEVFVEEGYRASVERVAQGTTQVTYAATMGSVAEVGRRWGHCTREAGWGLNSQIHALGDGAEYGD